ncbi:hypothetical protein [Sinorhizobium meliloti]|uniref:hypothetical protein n=1 Tax=Rhizobium meliloti TaxID=382 RepID=UPI0012FD7103|nr:hypothetical protein [Sinorhizobium meliloti]
MLQRFEVPVSWIVVLGLFIIPYLRVGGMSFFKMESSDTSDKPFAQSTRSI